MRERTTKSPDYLQVELDNPHVSWHSVRGVQDDRDTRVWVRGYAWIDGKCRIARHLAAWWCNELCLRSDELKVILEHGLERSNGSFALVIETSNSAAAAVDRLRSIPLFYGTSGNRFLVSDDADHVRRFCGDTKFDKASVTEFLLARYVTGRDTLYASVKQIRPGEMILFKREQCIPQTHRVRYYRFTHGDYLDKSKEELYAIMEDAYDQVFSRLVKSVQGRRIVVPLSGGLDSRSIVVNLKRMGVEDVLCFSYGAPGNWESEISREVARRLGHPWYFVPSTRGRWREWFRSPECWAYHLYGSGLTSLAHLQDWPAVREMKKAGVLAVGDVMVPGHTGDFISGGHIPAAMTPGHEIRYQDVARAIANKHYTLWNWEDTSPETADFIAERLRPLLPCTEVYTADAAVDAYESWEWQERQAKYIVNSIRVYEYWGFSWRIPLWDSEWMDLWSRVSLPWRVNKRLYTSYLEHWLFPICDVASSDCDERSRGRGGIPGIVAKMTNPRLGRYRICDYAKMWQRYGERFGHALRSPVYLMNTATLNVSVFLSNLKKHVQKGGGTHRDTVLNEVIQ